MSPVGRERFTVRVLRGGSYAPAGVGFVVGERHVLTCAHVVNAALSRDKRVQERPGDDTLIQVEFVMLGDAEGGLLRNCKIDAWFPPPKSGVAVAGGDIAGLVLVDEGLPERAGPALLDSAAPHRSEVEVFGYPDDPPRRARGTWTTLHLRGMVGGGLIQLDDNATSAIRAQPGYSGSPVVVKTKAGDAVAGMLAIASLDKNAGDAYAIPVSQLIDAWPGVLADRAIPPCPYRGLRNFTTADADQGLFVGRDEEIDQLRRMVTRQPLVMVAGASGSGKSSLIAAGLIPAVEHLGWLTAALRPGGKPFSAFAKLLAAVEVRDRTLTSDDLARWVSRLQSEELSELGSELALLRGTPILIHVDQLEEIFDPTVCPPEVASKFLTLLLGIQQSRGDDMHIACTLRSDFLPSLTAHADAGNRLRERLFIVPPMSMSRVPHVITQPAEATGVRFQDGLANRIVSDVGSGNGLALLEFLLEDLWGRQRRRLITLADYNGIGGATGVLGGYAEYAYQKVQEHFPATRIRRVLLALVRSREGAATATGRVVTREFLGQDWEVARALASHRLVVLDCDAAKGEVTAEIAHVALIREWPTLASWVGEDAEFQHWLAALEDRAAVGDILTGIRIDEADRWLGERPSDIHPDLVALVERSRSERHLRVDQVARRRGEDCRRQLRQIIADATAVADSLQSPSARVMRDIDERVARDFFRVMVVGEFNGGKSTLINAVLGARVLPASARPSTAVRTELRWSARPRAVLHPADGGGPVEVEVKDLASHITISAGAVPSRWKLAEVGWPLDMLRNGVVLVDSPGTNHITALDEVTLADVDRADAIVLVSDAWQGMSLWARGFAEIYLTTFDTVFFVVNKTDLLSDEDEVAEVRETILSRIQEFRGGGRDRAYFVSAVAGLQARISQDDAGWCATALAGFVDELSEFLATGPYPIKLAPLAARVSREIRELRRAVSIERALDDANEAELRQRYDNARVSLHLLEVRIQQSRRELALDQQHLQTVVRAEVTRRLLSMSSEIPEIFRQVAPDDELSFPPWNAKSVLSNYAHGVLQRATAEAESRFTAWQENELKDTLEPYLTSTTRRAAELFHEFSFDLATLSDGLAGLDLSADRKLPHPDGGTSTEELPVDFFQDLTAEHFGAQIRQQLALAWMIRSAGLTMPITVLEKLGSIIAFGVRNAKQEEKVRGVLSAALAENMRENAIEDANNIAIAFSEAFRASADKLTTRMSGDLQRVQLEDPPGLMHPHAERLVEWMNLLTKCADAAEELIRDVQLT